MLLRANFCRLSAVTVCPNLGGSNDVIDVNNCGSNATVGDVCEFSCDENTEASGDPLYKCDEHAKVWVGGSLTCTGRLLCSAQSIAQGADKIT